MEAINEIRTDRLPEEKRWVAPLGAASGLAVPVAAWQDGLPLAVVLVGVAVVATAVEWLQRERRRRQHEREFHAYLSTLRTGRVVLAIGAPDVSAATRTSIVRFLRRKA